MGYRVQTRDFKLQIARMLASGEKRPAQVCREYELAASVVSRWSKEYQERGEAAFAGEAREKEQSLEARIAELERDCGQLAMENMLLKKHWASLP
jgi:transposase-like protein